MRSASLAVATRKFLVSGDIMTVSDYVKRLAIMVCLAMPCTVVALTIVELRNSSERGQGLWSAVGGAAFLVYVWGVVTAIAVSVAHTYAMHSVSRGSLVLALAAGALLGLGAGAVTPTAFTGILNVNAILWGGFTGLVYAAIVWRLIPNTA